MSVNMLKSLVLNEKDMTVKATFTSSSLFTTKPMQNTLHYDTKEDFKNGIISLFKAYCGREYHFNTTNNYKWLSVFSDIAKVLRKDKDYNTLMQMNRNVDIYTELEVFKQLSSKYVDFIYSAMVHTKQQPRGMYYIVDSNGFYYLRKGSTVYCINNKELATTKYNKANSVLANVFNAHGKKLFIKKAN